MNYNNLEAKFLLEEAKIKNTKQKIDKLVVSYNTEVKTYGINQENYVHICKLQLLLNNSIKRVLYDNINYVKLVDLIDFNQSNSQIGFQKRIDGKFNIGPKVNSDLTVKQIYDMYKYLK